MSPADGDISDVVDPGSRTLVIKFGVLKLARLRILKISARNCRFRYSRMCVSFITEKSHSARPGPTYVSRPTFPKKPLLFGCAINALGLNHWFGVPSTTGPVNAGFRNGRTGLRVSPVLDGLYPSCGVNGNPDCTVTMLLTVHPPTRSSIVPEPLRYR